MAEDSASSMDMIDEMVMEEEEDMANKWVWIPHPERVWIQAQVISMLFDENNPDVTTEYLIDHPDSPGVFKKIFVKDCHKVDPTHILDLDNICLMNDMHEAPLLDLLRKRFLSKHIYTYAGDILISVNPYEVISDFYDEPLQFFSLAQNNSLEEAVIGESQTRVPHVYQIANRALCSLTKEHLVHTDPNSDQENHAKIAYNNQSVIISGESGAGKTENSKHVLNFLIAANNYLSSNNVRSTENDVQDVFAQHMKKVVGLSSLLLEAFGNAKTVRNDNSSRFGKYIKLLYLPHRKSASGKLYPRLVSAQTETFLLEKSRLSCVGENERCYHIFYQMLGGLGEDIRSHLHLHHDVDQFKLLFGGGCGVTSDDASEYNSTLYALECLNCSTSEIEQIFALLAAVLHLGNFVLNDGVNVEEGGGSEIVKLHCPTMPLDELADILGLEVGTLKLSLTMQQLVIARRASLKVKILSPAEVENNISALLKLIYSNLFEWIVRKINSGHAAIQHVKDAAFIGILDIFGFEILNINSFEQLCINFTNERLQQQFNQYVFVKEQEMYQSEGLEWNNISFRDNQLVIDTIAGTKKPNLGLLLLIEELGMLNRKPDDIALISAFNQIHDNRDPKLKVDPNNPPVYFKSRLGKEYFVVRHFAGDVTYFVEGFLAKNNDTLQTDLMKLLTTTKNEFLRNIMKFPDCCQGQSGYIAPLDIENVQTSENVPVNVVSNKKLAASISVSSQFRNQLDTLMTTLTSTSPNYIKCIKPNALKRREVFQSDLVNQQLRYSGVLEVVRIRREGFPLRLTFFDYYRDYEILAKGKSRFQFPDPLTCTFEEARRCCILLTASCLKSDQYKIGHSLVFLRDNGKKMMIDAIKGFFHKKVAKVQALHKMKEQRKIYLNTLENVKQIQALAKGFVYRIRYAQMKRAVSFLKRYLAFAVQRLKFCRIYYQMLHEIKVKKVLILQKLFRGRRGRKEYWHRYNLRMQYLNQKATKIQARYRGHWRRLWYKDARLHIAATIIQRLVRKRMAYNKVSEKSYAIMVIQSFARMCLARFYAARAMKAVIAIQAVCRQGMVRQRYLLSRRCIVKIQSQFRRHLAVREVLIQVASIWMLQSVVRMWMAKRRFKFAQKAAIMIQKHVRMYQAIQGFMQQYFAIIYCQKIIRGFVGRLRYKSLCHAVFMLQSFCRMSTWRLRFRRHRRSVVKIQALYRSKIEKRAFSATLNKIIIIQTFARRYIAIYNKKKALASIVKLQSFGRMLNQKRKYDEATVATITIQASIRRKIFRNRFLRVLQKVCLIEALFRRAKARIDRKRAMSAIVKLQSLGRMWNQKNEYDQMYVSIITVQAVWRRKLARMHYRTSIKSAIKLQSWMRMCLALSNYYYHLAAIIAMQSFARRAVAVSRLRYAQIGAICIQAYSRMFVMKMRYKRMQMSCARLQPIIKMFLCRRKYKIALKAQVTISKVFRGHHTYQEFKWTLKAIKRIQRWMKRRLLRFHFNKRLDSLFQLSSTLNSKSFSGNPMNELPSKFLLHLKSHPEDRSIRFATHDFCTLGQSLVMGKQGLLLENIKIQLTEAFEVDRFARNAAHYLGMYPSIDCLRNYLSAINTFKYQSTQAMAALDEDDDDNDDDEQANENIKQLKVALHMSVGHSTLKQGWLKKKRSGWNWQKRWFVLTEDYIIYYKNPQSTNNPKFAIPLEGCTVQRSTASKDAVIELTSPNMGEKKKLFGGSKTSKMISFQAETEKELQEWLMPLKAVAGVNTLRATPPVQYVQTELYQLWMGAVDKNLETPLHLLVRYHCMREGRVSRGAEGAKQPARRVSVIQKIKQSIVAQKSSDQKDTPLKKSSPDDPFKLVDTDVEFSLDETIEVLAWLVEFGCPINAQNYVGETALHLALLLRADTRLVRALLLKGSDPKSFKNDQGMAPFDLISSQPEIKARYLEVFSSSTRNIGALFRTAPERTYAAASKLKGYSYLSIFIGYQIFESSKAIVNEKSTLVISAYNSSRQLIETAKEMKSPVWLEDGAESSNKVGDGFKVFWGCSWHMQTPLDNIEAGSFLVIEYKSPPVVSVSSGNIHCVSANCDLDTNAINSGTQLLLMNPTAETTKQPNPLFTNNDKSTLKVEFVVNQKNRAIDYKMIYGV